MFSATGSSRLCYIVYTHTHFPVSTRTRATTTFTSKIQLSYGNTYFGSATTCTCVVFLSVSLPCGMTAGPGAPARRQVSALNPFGKISLLQHLLSDPGVRLDLAICSFSLSWCCLFDLFTFEQCIVPTYPTLSPYDFQVSFVE